MGQSECLANFTNRFTVVRPIQRVNIDLTHGMLRELDARAARLNISRHAVIKTLLDQALSAAPKRRAGKPRPLNSPTIRTCHAASPMAEAPPTSMKPASTSTASRTGPASRTRQETPTSSLTRP
jgi:hypothetical protein